MAQLTPQEEASISLLVSGGMSRKSAVQKIRRGRGKVATEITAPPVRELFVPEVPFVTGPDFQQTEATPVPGTTVLAPPPADFFLDMGTLEIVEPPAPEFTPAMPLAVGDKVELASTGTVETVAEAGPVTPKANKWAEKRAAAIARPEFQAAYTKALAKSKRTACSAGHEITPENTHVADLLRTGNITCNTCNVLAQEKYRKGKEAKQ